MRLNGLRFTVLLISVFLMIFLVPLSSATPYWLKPGVYIEYAAMRDDAYIHYQVSHGYSSAQLTHTAFLVYIFHNTPYKIYAYNDTYLKFKILGEKEGYLTVGVCIKMNNVTVRVSIPAGENLSPIWEQNEVIKVETIPTPGNSDTREYKVYLRSLRIEGVYRIRESDGAVFSLNGTYYGHTLLWVDPNTIPRENKTFVVFSSINWTMKVGNVSPLNKPVRTYYGKFGPPVATLSLLGPPLVMKGIVEFTTQTPESLRYDPSTGMILSPTTLSILISPDLAAIGIPFASFTDERVAYNMEVKRDISWAGLLPLYDTNAEFQEVQKVPFSKARTLWEYLFLGSLVVLGAVLSVRVLRR